jgi:hypothetical protein
MDDSQKPLPMGTLVRIFFDMSTYTISHKGQIRLPLHDRKRDLFSRVSEQAISACEQLLDQVDIDRFLNQVKNLPFLSWLTAGREDSLENRRRFLAAAKEQEGFHAFWKVPLFEIQNHYYRLRRALYLNSPKPVPVSALIRPEKVGLVGICAITVAVVYVLTPSTADSSVPPSAPTTTVVTSMTLPASVSTPIRKRFEVIETGNVNTKLVSFGTLSGENMGRWQSADKRNPRNLNALYAGIEGRAPETASVNYCGQLGLAWQAKLARKEITPATVQNIPYTINSYCNGTRTLTDLPTYLGDVEERIDASYAAIDFTGLCAKFKVDETGCALVRKTVRGITAEHIGGYGLTEIMPRTKDGRFNAAMLDHLFRNAGIEFVMSVPALGDPLGSKGLFQFTWMGHSNSPQRGRQGAAHLNTFVPREFKIPESVIGPMGLKPNDHDRAAYYFATYNIVNLVAKLDNKQRHALNRTVNEGRIDEVAEFIATSHHAQGSVRRFARRWLAQDAKKPFREYLKGRFITYGMKFRHNLAGTRYFLETTEES